MLPQLLSIALAVLLVRIATDGGSASASVGELGSGPIPCRPNYREGPTELGRCDPNVPVAPDFDLLRYVGTWYEFKRTYIPFQAYQECVNATYTALISEPPTIVVHNRGRRRAGTPAGVCVISDAAGVATVPDVSEPAKLRVRFGGPPESAESANSTNYWVLATDYQRYTVVYSCTEEVEARRGATRRTVLVWILSRRRDGIDFATELALHRMLADRGLDRYVMYRQYQTDCGHRAAASIAV